MPQVIIKGMDIEDIKKISTPLIDELTEIIGCPRDYFTVEAPNTVFIADGQETKGSPMVQVNWFDRGQDVQDRAALAIDHNIRGAGYAQVEIYFLILGESKYYENGKHY